MTNSTNRAKSKGPQPPSASIRLHVSLPKSKRTMIVTVPLENFARSKEAELLAVGRSAFAPIGAEESKR